MLFKVSSGLEVCGDTVCYLIEDNWNDWWRFKTQYSLVVVRAGHDPTYAGDLKIGQRRQLEPRPSIPREFHALGPEFVSLGQSENYYETLRTLGEDVSNEILSALRDCAFNLELFEEFDDEEVMVKSLLRHLRDETVRGRFHRLATGDATLRHFQFSYRLPLGDVDGSGDQVELKFDVHPRSLPPTNVHALIGRNGVGKTRCLNLMTHAVLTGADDPKYGRFSCQPSASGQWAFDRLVLVSFSAFDEDALPGKSVVERSSTRFAYIGVRKLEGDPGSGVGPKSPKDFADEFVGAVRACRVGARAERWRQALEALESDPLFQDRAVAELADVEDACVPKEAAALFNALSSGHKIVLLTLTRLVEFTDERTLVLMDEPEAHLHPPLLSSLVSAISALLVQRNGVAVMATHSPVVLQETPASCVSVVSRVGERATVGRPTIETFGESVGVLTREVFGLEVTSAGFHRLVAETVNAYQRDYDSVVNAFNGQLGGEAKGIARALVLHRDRGQ